MSNTCERNPAQLTGRPRAASESNIRRQKKGSSSLFYSDEKHYGCPLFNPEGLAGESQERTDQGRAEAFCNFGI